jgi:hypothetical protein
MSDPRSVFEEAVRAVHKRKAENEAAAREHARQDRVKELEAAEPHREQAYVELKAAGRWNARLRAERDNWRRIAESERCTICGAKESAASGNLRAENEQLRQGEETNSGIIERQRIAGMEQAATIATLAEKVNELEALCRYEVEPGHFVPCPDHSGSVYDREDTLTAERDQLVQDFNQQRANARRTAQYVREVEAERDRYRDLHYELQEAYTRAMGKVGQSRVLERPTVADE